MDYPSGLAGLLERDEMSEGRRGPDGLHSGGFGCACLMPSQPGVFSRVQRIPQEIR
jgi:hypothetical protein